MSSFTEPLIVRVEQRERNGKGLYTIMEPFIYRVGSKESQDEIAIMPGFETDFASIPWFARGLISPGGLHAKAAVVHDALYRGKARINFSGLSRKQADDIFLEAMKVLKVPKIRRRTMHAFVRLFGDRIWVKLAKDRHYV